MPNLTKKNIVTLCQVVMSPWGPVLYYSLIPYFQTSQISPYYSRMLIGMLGGEKPGVIYGADKGPDLNSFRHLNPYELDNIHSIMGYQLEMTDEMKELLSKAITISVEEVVKNINKSAADIVSELLQGIR